MTNDMPAFQVKFVVYSLIAGCLAGCLFGCELYSEAARNERMKYSDIIDTGANSHVDLNVARYLKLIHEDLLRIEKAELTRNASDGGSN